jgi:hypothetical protein
VAIDQLAHVLALVWALLHNVTIVLEQMVYEELIEVAVRTVRVFVNLPGKGLAED